MKRGDCGTCWPPAEDSPDREAVDRFAEFLRLVGRPGEATPSARWLIRNDPEWAGYVRGAHPLTLDDVR